MPGLGKASSQATSKAPGEASASQQKDHLQADGKVKYGDYSRREHVSPPLRSGTTALSGSRYDASKQILLQQKQCR